MIETAKRLLSLSLLVILTSSLILSATYYQEGAATLRSFALVPLDPLGSFEGPGTPGTVSRTGDGQRLSNPSFETGILAPWFVRTTFAASGSQAELATPGYEGSSSVRLTLFSGNISTSSVLSVTQDLSQEQVGFSSGVRLRTSAFVESLTGSSTADRVEVVVVISYSFGGSRSLHYIFAGGQPTDTVTDAYFTVFGGPATGQWLTADINVPKDAQSRFANFTSFNTVQEIRLLVYAQTVGNNTDDSHIRYDDTSSNSAWNSGEPVVYDLDLDGTFDTGEQVLAGIEPSVGTALLDDPKIKYVDSNRNNVWNNPESIVWDNNNNGIYEYQEPVVRLPTPPAGTLLMNPVQKTARSLFDRVELYSASGGSDWVLNGGFEAGLSSWVKNSSFASSSSTFHSGSFSARGSLTNGAAEMSQSIDARPVVDASTRFRASVNIATMSGTSPSDIVDLWLGLVDSQGQPVSLYFVFKTGDGSIPTGSSDAVYRAAPGFGNLAQWLNIDTSLEQELSAFSSLGYSSPYRIELVVLEVVARGVSASTTAFFDDLSIQVPGYSGMAQSYFYAADAVNSTYVYTASMIPQGSFYVQIPLGLSVLNVTSPEGTALLLSDFTTSAGTQRRVDVPASTMFKHSPVGDWRVFATSTNAVGIIYAEDQITKRPATGIDVGSTVNLVSQSRDPFGTPLFGASVSLTLWDQNGVNVGSWDGTANVLGWWNASNVVLPPAGNPDGEYKLQASVYSGFAGLRTFRVSVIYILILSLTVSSVQLSAGSSVTISGDAKSPSTGDPRAGIDLTLYYRRAGDSSWTSFATVTTDSDGKFSHNWTPPEGDYEVVVSIGDPQTASTQSPRDQIFVGPGGVLNDPILILLMAGVAAAAILLAVVVLRKKKVAKPTQA